MERIERDGNRKIVVFRNTLSGATRQQTFNHVVCETGSKPMDSLYFDLINLSRNAGQIDLRKFAKGKVLFPQRNPTASFDLVRLGDAVTSRNLHAAVFDANRLVQGLR